MVIPGDVAEMTEFQEKHMNNSRFVLELCFPNVQLALPSKMFYEKLHNRYRCSRSRHSVAPSSPFSPLNVYRGLKSSDLHPVPSKS